MSWWLLAIAGLLVAVVGQYGEAFANRSFAYNRWLAVAIDVFGLLFGLLYLLGTLAFLAGAVLGMADASGSAVPQWPWP